MPTKTEIAQQEVEDKCLPSLQSAVSPSSASEKPKHVRFLRFVLGLDADSPAGFLALDASHPWLVFWPVNASSSSNEPLNSQELARIGESLLACQSPDGGFGGGPGQPGHLAATYAAIMALAHTGPEYWRRIDTAKLLQWILSLKRADGSIRVCRHGEADPRSTYCALASSRMSCIRSAEVVANVGRYIRSCQTYEGGFANMPHGEAHGGYAFCSVATLLSLDEHDARAGIRQFCDIPRLERWLAARQDSHVPGFSGRTNKLVDGCYSHWVGACWPSSDQVNTDPKKRSPYSRRGLHDYIVKCCQDTKNGGLRDKPGMRPDAYHTNYVSCGLSCARFVYELDSDTESVFKWRANPVTYLTDSSPKNDVEPINPVFGIPLSTAERMHAWFVDNEARSNQYIQAEAAYQQAVPSSKEYQGFASFLGASAVSFAYLAWALVPADVLRAMHLNYYPSRWWAVASPAFVLMLMLYIYIASGSYNTERLTFPSEAPQTICDRDTTVQDTPIVEVNHELYSRMRGKDEPRSRN